jgi:hypothetical protein
MKYLLTFMIEKPLKNVVRISFVDGKIHASSSRFTANWVDSNDLLTVTNLNDHAKTSTKEETVTFKCPKCRRKKGVTFFSISQGPFMTDLVKNMVTLGESLGHWFGCLVCGKTWPTQSV